MPRRLDTHELAAVQHLFDTIRAADTTGRDEAALLELWRRCEETVIPPARLEVDYASPF